MNKQRYFPPTVQPVCIPYSLPSLLATMSMPGQVDADFGYADDFEKEEWGA